jgi:hypothetical protein
VKADLDCDPHRDRLAVFSRGFELPLPHRFDRALIDGFFE